METAVAVTQARLPMPVGVGDYGIDGAKWKVLVESIFPTAKTPEAVEMALAYCKARDMDIMKRPVHIVPVWDKQRRCEVETVWAGLHEVRSTAHRTSSYAGIDPIEFGPMLEKRLGDTNVNFPEWAKVTVYRMVQGTRCPFTQTVHWLETYSGGRNGKPSPMWVKRPNDQLAKCAEVAALRMAFPEELGNEYVAEEMAGKEMEFAAPKTIIKAEPKLVKPVEGEVITKQGGSARLDALVSAEPPAVTIEASVNATLHADPTVQQILKAFPESELLNAQPTLPALTAYVNKAVTALEGVTAEQFEGWKTLLRSDVLYLRKCDIRTDNGADAAGKAVQVITGAVKTAQERLTNETNQQDVNY